MKNQINLAVYNPAILADNDFLEGFVARHELAERLLSRLREIDPKNVAQHLLLIGQRGMGKTSMLRRLALGVVQDQALSAVLIPLSFREEQYNVHNLNVFWCNCLDALGDHLEKIGQRDQAAQLDRAIESLASKGEPDGATASALFKEWCEKEGKRPLLLVDNIDLIFGGLKEQHQWGLRRILQERGGVVIVGASAGFLEAAAKVEAPFYDFFQVHQLEKLNRQEILTCLRQIALKRGEAGGTVIQVLNTDPARIHTLYDLTGGNPRTLVLLYLLLEMDSEGGVMDDLERLLDQVTALYKARVEDLAPQTRVVLDAVALAWDPVTVAKVAACTGIEATSISSQFDRLLKMGILEKVSLSTPAPTGYQLGERFFNIWYLMRNASRRVRSRFRWLTEFLRRLYTPQQLSTLANDFISRSRDKSRCSGVYGLALADALEDNTLRHTINHHVTRLFQEQAAALSKQVDIFVDRRDLDNTTLTMTEMRGRVLGCTRDWGNTSAEEFWECLGENIFISTEDKHAIVEQLENSKTTQIESLMDTFRKGNEKFMSKIIFPDAFKCICKAVGEGLLESRSDLAHVLSAAKVYESPEIPLVMLSLTENNSIFLPPEISQPLDNAFQLLITQHGDRLGGQHYYHLGRFYCSNDFKTKAEFALRKSIYLDPTNPAPWNDIGILLMDDPNCYSKAEEALKKAIEFDLKNWLPWANLSILLKNQGRYDESEQASRKFIELAPDNCMAWTSRGNLLQDHLGRYDESEQAFRKAIELDPTNYAAWSNLGELLRDHFGRYDESEQAFRKAIELNPTEYVTWGNLGNLLQDNLGRYDESEQAYRKALELAPEEKTSWGNLGNLLQNHLGRYDESEQAYHKAIEIDSKDYAAWTNLGNLLQDHLGRYNDSEKAYLNAIDLAPQNYEAWTNLGNLLQHHLERYEDSEKAYRKSLEFAPQINTTWHNLGCLLQYHLSRYDESEQAYLRTIELDAKDCVVWGNLGSLLQFHLSRYDEAEQAYYKVIELDPKNNWVWRNLGILLQHSLNRYDEAEQAYRKAIEITPEDPQIWNSLGNLLHNHLERFEDAEAAYHKAIDLDGNHLYAKGNLAYLLLSQPSRTEDAEAAYSEACSLLPEHGRQLLATFRALANDNFGEAKESLGQALEQNHPELFSVFYDDLLRLLRLTKKMGHGERLIAFLEESGLGERHWPLCVAFNAYLYGEEKLRDVNPEVRSAAQSIFDWLSATTGTKSKKTSASTSKKRKVHAGLKKGNTR